MKKDEWKYYDTVEELVKEVELRGEKFKWTILNYYLGGYLKGNRANYPRCERLLKEFLNSGLFTPLEITNRYKISHSLNTKDWEILRAYANKTWMSSTDAMYIYETPIILQSKVMKLISQISYFAENNLELCKELIDIIIEKEMYRNIPVTMLDTSNLEIIKYYTAKIKQREINKIYEDIQGRKDKDWRDITNYQLLGYRITKENKWEILEYFAEHNKYVFFNLITYYGSNFTSKLVSSYAKLDVLNHYAEEDLSKLPPLLSGYIEKLRVEIAQHMQDKQDKAQQSKIEKEQQREQKILSWYDDNGNLVQLFTISEMMVDYKQDYYNICKKYLQSDYSISGFCLKFKIEPKEGFEKMLDKISAENEDLAKQIADKKRERSENYIKLARTLIHGIVKGELSVLEATKNSMAYSFEDILELAKKLFKDERVCELFAFRVINYYHERLNSYNNSLEEENLVKFLTRDEIRFIIGNEEFDKFRSGKEINLGLAFYNNVKFLREKFPKVIESKVTGFGQGKIGKELEMYSSTFKQKQYLKTETTIVLENGKTVTVTEEMVKQALNFAVANKLCASLVVVKKIIKAVANGKIKPVGAYANSSHKTNPTTIEELLNSSDDVAP